MATDTTIIIPARLSYMNLFAPKTNDLNGKREYSVVLLIPKKAESIITAPSDVMKNIKACVDAAAQLKFNPVPAKLRIPFRDGDAELNDDGNPRHPGYWFMNAKSGEDKPPLLIDGLRNPANAADWASGDYANVKIKFAAYDNAGNKGVGAYVTGVQFVERGERFGSATTPDDFAVVGAATGGGDYDPFA